jgi:phosphatidylglycerol:prolipoprotein diacylglycerol transferase
MEFLYIHWNIDPAMIKVGPITIHWYGLLFALSFFVGLKIMGNMLKKDNAPEAWLDKLFMSVIIGTVAGARLGHVLFYDLNYYLAHPSEILMIWKGGLASHGAAIGIIVACYLFSKKIDKSLLWVLDRVVLTVIFAAVFIRTGNLMNSEIIGQQTELPWAFVFERVDLLPRHPAQLYEAISYLLIAGLLHFLYWKKEVGQKLGVLFGLFLALVFTSRFFIEFIKANQVAFEDGMVLNMGQILSIPALLVGLYFIKKGYSKDYEKK